jgi:filamentous hemagglutinin
LRLKKADRNPYQQSKVGQSSGVAGDEGGHMIGTQFEGLGEGPLHMVPQGMKLNRGAGSKWRAMEEEWAAALRRGDKVSVKIEVDWPAGAKRPDGFNVTYQITDPVKGTTSRLTKSFDNP